MRLRFYLFFLTLAPSSAGGHQRVWSKPKREGGGRDSRRRKGPLRRSPVMVAGVKSRGNRSQSEQPNPGQGGAGITAAHAVQADTASLSLAPRLPNQECRDNNLGRSQAFADGVFGKLGNTPDL